MSAVGRREPHPPAGPAAVARRAAELVESGFTRETLARDAEGRPVDACGSTACAWCLYGAISRADWELNPDGRDAPRPTNATWAVIDALRERLNVPNLVRWAEDREGPEVGAELRALADALERGE